MTPTYREMDRSSEKIKSITSNMRILFKSIQLCARKVEKETGLTSAMLWMMWELFAVPGMKVSELARVLGIHASTCSNMLDKLETRGLVTRHRDREDQRTVHLYLTEEGSSILVKAPRPAQGAMNAALHNLNDIDLDKLADGLEALISSLQIIDRDAEFTPLFNE